VKESADEAEKKLWKEARKRVKFKNHLYSYLLINSALWLLWYFTDGKREEAGIPWPIFSTLFWGFGLMSHYAGVYLFRKNNTSRLDREYQKLKRERGDV
jgi:hypothetical protein